MFVLSTLIWLFPIAFILHDFEELMLFEPWFKKKCWRDYAARQEQGPWLCRNTIEDHHPKNNPPVHFSNLPDFSLDLRCLAHGC